MSDLEKIDVVQNLKDNLTARRDNTELVSFQFKETNFQSGGDGKVYVEIQDTPYLLTDGSFRQVAETLQVPVPFAKRVDDSLFETIFNYQAHNGHFADGGIIGEEFKNALVVDGRVRSLSNPENPYVPSIDVYNTLENAFDGDYDLRYINLSDDKMSFSMLPHEYKNAIDGSNLFGGIKVEFYESWAKFPQLDAYIWRELCSNGMIDKLDGVKFRASGKSEDQILEQINSFALASLQKIPLLFENFEKLLTEEVDDYEKLVARICQEYRLSNKIRDRLLFWAVQPDFLITISGQQIKNMHDIVNLITFAGSHDSELSTENRNLLLEIAGNLTLKHDDRCSHCGVII